MNYSEGFAGMKKAVNPEEWYAECLELLRAHPYWSRSPEDVEDYCHELIGEAFLRKIPDNKSKRIALFRELINETHGRLRSHHKEKPLRPELISLSNTTPPRPAIGLHDIAPLLPTILGCLSEKQRNLVCLELGSSGEKLPDQILAGDLGVEKDYVRVLRWRAYTQIENAFPSGLRKEAYTACDQQESEYDSMLEHKMGLLEVSRYEPLPNIRVLPTQEAESGFSSPLLTDGVIFHEEQRIFYLIAEDEMRMVRRLSVERKGGHCDNRFLSLVNHSQGRVAWFLKAGVKAKGHKYKNSIQDGGRSLYVFRLTVDLADFPEGERFDLEVETRFYGSAPHQQSWVAALPDRPFTKGIDLGVVGSAARPLGDFRPCLVGKEKGLPDCVTPRSGSWWPAENSVLWQIGQPDPGVSYEIHF